MFLLGLKSLIALLQQAENEKIIGIKICIGAPHINHLLFADDNVVFCKASMQENANIQALLGEYEHISG